jgi:hypothetical protein
MSQTTPSKTMEDVVRQLLADHQPQSITPAPGVYDYGYGMRHVEPGSGEVSAPKGVGWLGALGNGNGVSTEISVTDDQGRTFPSMVPGLLSSEYGLLKGGQVSDSVFQRAAGHAERQRNLGRGPYFDNNYLKLWKPGDRLPAPYEGSYR